jgi:hypothetical protein
MIDLRTTQTDAPPGLEQGLYLENHRVLLPWYTPHRTTRMLLGFEDARPDKDTLTWNGMICLSGLDCSISGRFVLDQAHDAAKPCLRLIEFRVKAEPGEVTEGLYGRIKAHLGEQLGVPTLVYDGSQGYLPAFTEWDGKEVIKCWWERARRGAWAKFGASLSPRNTSS